MKLTLHELDAYNESVRGVKHLDFHVRDDFDYLVI